jgi:hypothetical protein
MRACGPGFQTPFASDGSPDGRDWGLAGRVEEAGIKALPHHWGKKGGRANGNLWLPEEGKCGGGDHNYLGFQPLMTSRHALLGNVS